MALQTSLVKIKAVAGAHASIQALTGSEQIVTLVLDWVVRNVNETEFGTRTEEAQTYLGAHMLAQSFETGAGKGSISSRTVGGISQSWTMPYLNPATQLGSTIWGSRFLEIRKARVMPFRVITV
jgi:hypothetical protein